MSLKYCKLCTALCDTDAHPAGFYTKEHPDDYVCDNCIETWDLTSKFDEV